MKEVQASVKSYAASVGLGWNVFNLVTKERYWNKPTYGTLHAALIDMKRQCVAKNIKRLAIPRLGCGLDRLEWEKVRRMITGVFDDTDIEILVCSLEGVDC